MKIVRDLWKDETAAVFSAKGGVLLLIVALIATGLVWKRAQAQEADEKGNGGAQGFWQSMFGADAAGYATGAELSESARAIRSLNQSYSFPGYERHGAWVAGSSYRQQDVALSLQELAAYEARLRAGYAAGGGAGAGAGAFAFGGNAAFAAAGSVYVGFDGFVFLYVGGEQAYVFGGGGAGAGAGAFAGLTAVDLTARGDAAITDAGLMQLGGGSILAAGADARLLSALSASGQMTLSTVFTAAAGDQQGPARIVTFSSSNSSRNFTLAQQGDQLIFRLRTPQTGLNGDQPQLTLARIQAGRQYHLLVTYRDGQTAVYLNGRQVLLFADVRGDFSNWSPQHLVFGNEFDGDFPWQGTIASVVIYDRALTPQEAGRMYIGLRPLYGLPRSAGLGGATGLLFEWAGAESAVLYPRGDGLIGGGLRGDFRDGFRDGGIGDGGGARVGDGAAGGFGVGAGGVRGQLIPLEARGRANITPDGLMQLAGGAIVADAASAGVLNALGGAGQFSAETVLIAPAAAPEGLGRIFSFSSGANSRNFTIGQSGEQLLLRLRTTGTGPNDVPPEIELARIQPNEQYHLLLTYQPGQLAVYLDGEQVLLTDRIRGNFRNWGGQHLLFGDEYDGGFDWAGSLAYAALFNRALSPAEARLRFADSGRRRRGAIHPDDLPMDGRGPELPQDGPRRGPGLPNVPDGQSGPGLGGRPGGAAGGALFRFGSDEPSLGTLVLRAQGRSRLDNAGAMELDGGFMTADGRTAGRLLGAVSGSNAFTLESVIGAGSVEQGSVDQGPARIISFSSGANSRNFMLGQEGSNLVFRLRTSETDKNGARFDLGEISAAQSYYVGVSYDSGAIRAFINGEQVELAADLRGDFSTWERQTLLFGDEIGGQRMWKGRIHYAAAYARALDPNFIKARYRRLMKGDVHRPEQRKQDKE